MNGSKLAAIVLATTVVATPLIMQTGCGRREKAMDVISPDFALENYRWFKDQSAALTQVDSQIKSEKDEIEAYRKDFADKPRSDWPFDAREELARKEAVLRGYISQYNMLAKDYNSHVSDFTRKWTKGEPSKDVAPYLKSYDPKQ